MKTSSSYSAGTKLFTGTVTGLFGSLLTLKIAGLPEKKALGIWGDVTRRLGAISKCFDCSDPHSEVSLLNSSSKDIETSEEFKSVLNTCEGYFVRTEKLFSIYRNDDELDFSSFVKGYCVGEVAAILKKGGAKDALVDYGREIIWASGNGPFSREGWLLSITDPETEDEIGEKSFGGGLFHALRVRDGALQCFSAKVALDVAVFMDIVPKASGSQLEYIKASLGIK